MVRKINNGLYKVNTYASAHIIEVDDNYDEEDTSNDNNDEDYSNSDEEDNSYSDYSEEDSEE